MSKITDWLNTNRSASTPSWTEDVSTVNSSFPSISDIKLTPNEQFNLPEGTTKYDLLLADGSEVFESEHPVYYATLPEGGKVRATISSGSDLVPYRVVADKHTPSIGDVRRSDQLKYSEDGVAVFDYLLADKGEINQATHPLLWEATTEARKGQILLNNDFVDGTTSWLSNGAATLSVTGGTLTVSRNGGAFADQCHQTVIASSTEGNTISASGVTPITGLVSLVYYIDGDTVGVEISGWLGEEIVLPSGTEYKIAINGATAADAKYTVDAVYFNGGALVKFLPENTSPYPNFPDRVVADLTEGDL